jgi:hypothetical protein
MVPYDPADAPLQSVPGLTQMVPSIFYTKLIKVSNKIESIKIKLTLANSIRSLGVIKMSGVFPLNIRPENYSHSIGVS